MILTLYKCLDGDNVINKTLTNPTPLNIVLKKNVDLNNIELVLSGVSGLQDGEYNYFHISDIDKYYFIRSIRVLNNDSVRVIGEVDVLETYKDDILNSESSFKRKIELGDYGSVDVIETGRFTNDESLSNIEFTESEYSILSLYRWR